MEPSCRSRAQRSLVRGAAAFLACVALILTSAPVAANHVQTDAGKTIVFDHKTGNDHWVEVVLGGTDAGTVQRVEAQEQSSGYWNTLEKKSWGAWGGSFLIGSGTEVRFRATWADGTQAVSCWFTHPQGVESCRNPSPPAGWRAEKIATSGKASSTLDLAVVDTDADGRDEVFVPTRDGVFQYERQTDGTWRQTTVFPGFTQERYIAAAGDIDADGEIEVYTAGWHYDGTTGRDYIYHHEWNGMGWESNLVTTLPWDVRSMVFGDVDDDGDEELYIGTANGFSGHAIYVLDRPAGGHHSIELITVQPAGYLAIGDADRDGDDELFAGGWDGDRQGLWIVDRTPTHWSTDLMHDYGFSWEVRDLAVGDGDHDGRLELYVLVDTHPASPQIHRYSMQADGTWRLVQIPLGDRAAFALALGDGDGDGVRELYVGDVDGRIHRVHWSGTTWVRTIVAQVGSGDPLYSLRLGDGDGDGKDELYAGGWPASLVCCVNVNLYRIAFTGAPPPPPGFDATFSGVRGNEWWVQVNVAANGGTLASVDVRLNGGAWQPLTKQSWGGWAKSTRIVQGTQVQFRAISTTGATDLSDCYQWIPPSNQDAAKVACGSAPPPPAFDATFSGVKGNEWWVQANVAANQPLAGVDARVNCGTWVPLTKQSWGGWAKSFHVPDGSKVDFRARSTMGGQEVSGAYVWPSATPTGAC